LIRRNKGITALVILLALSATARAEGELPLGRANVDGVLQANPQDLHYSGSRNYRLGFEAGLEFPTSRYVDLGLKFSIGDLVGVRVVGSLHTDRSQRVLNPFGELRAIVHPAGGDVGVGVGGWFGATYELGPGRLELGPSVEFYTAPNSGRFRNYAVLGLFGYQFDFSNPRLVEPAATASVPIRQNKQLAPEAIPTPEANPAPQTEREPVLAATVLFPFDSDELTANARKTLDVLSESIPEDANIVIAGHTDSIGTDAYNRGLSRRRAYTVGQFLCERLNARLQSFHILGAGFGASHPKVSNKTRDGRRKNRRVEIYIKAE
jgi:outer membrane protein OmpA-like peptidoglycan-associated protein